MRFFTDKLPLGARVYLTVVTLLGSLVALFSYVHVAYYANSDWLYLAALTGVAAFLPVRLRFSGDQVVSVSFTVSDVFLFCGLFFFSPQVAVCVGVIDAALISLQFLEDKRTYRFAFNVGQVSLSLFLVGQFFYFVQGHPTPLSSNDAGLQTFVNVAACGLLYFMLNTSAVLSAMLLSSSQPKKSLWHLSIYPSAFSTVTGALTAAAIFFTFENASLFGVAVTLPLILVIYLSYRMANDRVEALLESRSLLQDSLDALKSYIAILDDKGRIMATNQAWQRFRETEHLFGSALETGHNYLRALESNMATASEAVTEIARGIKAVIERKTPEYQTEYSIKANNADASFNVRVTRFRGDGATRVVVLHEDITSRKRAEEALRDSEERYRQFFEDDLTGDFTASLDGQIFTCNAAFAKIFGFESIEHASSSNFFSLFPSQEDIDTLLSELREKSRLEYYDIKLHRIDAEPVHVVANLTSQIDEDSIFSTIRGYLFDDTGRKSLEDELRQAQKMEAVGQLAGGIAHDLNNILTVITGYGEFLNEALWNDSEMQEDAQAILDAADRARGLTTKLLAFGRRQVLKPEVVDMNKVASDFISLLGRVIRADIEVVTQLDPEIGFSRIDPGQLEQVLMNLALNGQDAMPEGGKLTVRTQRHFADGSGDHEPANLTVGEYVIISVHDTGGGISEKAKERIFEPFFTTKPTGQGTGLGLSIVYGIVRQSGGHIQVDSEVGKGTTFEIWLPIVEPVAGLTPQTDDADGETMSLAGVETVLLVEDEDRIRKLIREILSRQGYTVFEASNGDLAIPVAQKLDHLDLLITDLVMPGMGGWELARELRRLRKDKSLRVLYMSGYPDSIKPELLKGGAGVSFLGKPFTPRELLRKAREVLGSPAEPPA